MSIHTVINVDLLVGDSTTDRPSSPPKEIIFFPVDSKRASIYTDGAWSFLDELITVVSDIDTLKSIVAARRSDQQVVYVADGQSYWQFNAFSSLTGDDLFVAVPDAGTGRWLRVPGAMDLVLPFDSSTADATILATLPDLSAFQFINAYWEVTVDMLGGTNSAIGVSSSNLSGATTKGDLLGGATGDVAATLVAGSVIPGTIGVGVNSVAKLHAAVLSGGKTIRFDRITSAFTSGNGNIHIVGNLLANPGS